MKLNSNSKYAHNAVIAVRVVGAILLLHLVTLIIQFFYYNHGTGGDAFIDFLTKSSIVSLGLILCIQVSIIVAAIFFVLWFNKAYVNLRLIKKTRNYNTDIPGMYFFIPILSVFIPYIIMKEMYSEVDNHLTMIDQNENEIESNGKVGMWWGFWLLYGFANLFYIRGMPKNDFGFFIMFDRGELIHNCIVNVLITLIGLIATYYCIKVIQMYDTEESKIKYTFADNLIQ
jgi:hypothetical protein